MSTGNNRPLFRADLDTSERYRTGLTDATSLALRRSRHGRRSPQSTLHTSFAKTHMQSNYKRTILVIKTVVHSIIKAWSPTKMWSPNGKVWSPHIKT